MFWIKILFFAVFLPALLATLANIFQNGEDEMASSSIDHFHESDQTFPPSESHSDADLMEKP
jgi:hypothetical protein